MKKITRILAIVLAIVVLACPLASAAGTAVTAGESNSFSVEVVKGDSGYAIKATVSAIDGFMLTTAKFDVTGIALTEDDATVTDYAVITDALAANDEASAEAYLIDGVLTLYIAPKSNTALPIYASVTVEIPVTVDGAYTVTATNLKAATDIGNTEYNVNFGFADTKTGAIDAAAAAEAGCVIEAAGTAACEHVWDAGVVTTPAGKTDDGVKTFTCTLCEETKTEAIPHATEKSSLRVGRSVRVQEKMGIWYTLPVADYKDYAKIEFVISAQHYNGSTYNLEAATETVIEKDPSSTATYDYYSFTGMAAYEFALPIVATVYCYDADGNMVNYSSAKQDSLQALSLGALGKTSTTEAAKNKFIDLANYAEEARKFLTENKTSSNLYSATPLNDGFDAYQSFAGKHYPETLVTTDIKTPSNGNTTTLVGCQVQVSASNYIFYTIRPMSYNVNTLNLKIKYDGSDGIKTDEAMFTDTTKVTPSSSYYQYSYSGICLYDADKEVTIEIYDDQTLVFTRVYTLESYAAARIKANDHVDFYKALVNFSHSAHYEFFGN